MSTNDKVTLISQGTHKLQEYLHSKSEKELKPKDGKVITVSMHDTPDQALQKLVHAEVQSAPVVDENNTVVGIISVRDLTAKVLNLLDKHKLKSEFFVKEVSSAVPVICVNEGTDLLTVLKALAQGMYRVVVVDEAGHLKNIISHSSMMKFISHDLSQLGDLAKASVSDLGLGKHGVMSAHKHDQTLEVFKKMLESNITGLPLVDDEGKLLTAISFSDIKGIGKGFQASALYSTVSSFINHVRASEIDIRNPAISIHAETPLGNAIQLLAASKTHRVFVTDQNNFPKGVISLSDIVRLLAQ